MKERKDYIAKGEIEIKNNIARVTLEDGTKFTMMLPVAMLPQSIQDQINFPYEWKPTMDVEEFENHLRDIFYGDTN